METTGAGMGHMLGMLYFRSLCTFRYLGQKSTRSELIGSAAQRAFWLEVLVWELLSHDGDGNCWGWE